MEPERSTPRLIDLSQRLYEQVQALEALEPPREGLFCRSYRVVDLQLVDGRTVSGVLVLEDHLVLTRPDVALFESEDVVAVSATPESARPDFEARARAHAAGGGLVRGLYEQEWLTMFGPEPDSGERDWRQAPPEEAHAEALRENRYIESYGGELPASVHGPRDVALTPDGVAMTLLRPDDMELRVSVWPRGARLWRALLSRTVTLHDGFTLGHLLRLVDLKPAVAREVYLRTMDGDRMSFRPWIEAARRAGDHTADDIEALVIEPVADRDRGYVSFGFHVYGLGHELDADEAAEVDGPWGAGDRIPWGIGFSGIDRLVGLPLRYEEALTVPAEHDETMAFLRGPHRAWRRAGEPGEAPAMPVTCELRRRITLGELIGAVFFEVGAFASRDREASPGDGRAGQASSGDRHERLRERAEAVDDAIRAGAEWLDARIADVTAPLGRRAEQEGGEALRLAAGAAAAAATALLSWWRRD